MRKNLLFVVFFLSVLGIGFAFLPSQNSAELAAKSTSSSNSARMTRTGHPRVGLGFNGIPFDGSHREATRQRRAYRNAR